MNVFFYLTYEDSLEQELKKCTLLEIESLQA
jgi:hypothetical protein